MAVPTESGSWTAASPTEETLEQMRTGDSPVHYLVGTPKGRLSKFEKKFLTLPWQAVRPSVDGQALVP